MLHVDPDRLLTHLRHLTLNIGVRLAGMPGEAAAVRYVAEQFAATGAAVTEESFPVQCRDVQEQQLWLRIGQEWRRYPCSLFSSTPGTGGELREAPLVFFASATDYQQPDLSHLRGRAVVHLGTHIESRESYRRLLAAEPAFLLMVDTRYPGATPLADGMFPAYTRAIGAVPTLNVAYQDAWQWQVGQATAARIRIVGGMRPSTSANVIAELPGSDPAAGVLYACGHHDTQADSLGADDNGSGTVGILELARVLAPRPRRRTIRLISFGAEEQLSVGSAAYVRRHRDAIARDAVMVFNLDSYGSRLGWTQLSYHGPPELPACLVPHFNARGEYLVTPAGVVPYADHFPFAACGVPGVWLYRPNCAGGRFYHHRPDDDITRVDPHRMARLLDAVAAGLDHLANTPAPPFARLIPPEQATTVATYWQDLFGGWDG